jgi:hypothetical protein
MLILPPLLPLSDQNVWIMFFLILLLVLMRIPIGMMLYRREMEKTEAPDPTMPGSSLMLMIYWWKAEDSQFSTWILVLNGLLLLAASLMLIVLVSLSSSLYIAW